MSESSLAVGSSIAPIVKAMGEEPIFKPGDGVKISVRYPVGHYRVPRYIRGKRGSVESVIEPAAVNNEEEGFGRNAGSEGALLSGGHSAHGIVAGICRSAAGSWRVPSSKITG
jgi:hypothetical protein